MHNKAIETPLEAWLTFLSEENPERIAELIESFPEFKAMYETLYLMCQNTERVMEMFSEELRILDRNTVRYMIEEQQKEIDSQREALADKDAEIEEQQKEIANWRKEFDSQSRQLADKDAEIVRLRQELEAAGRKI